MESKSGSKDYVKKWREKTSQDPQKRADYLARERIRDKFRRERKREELSQCARKRMENKRLSAERKRKYRARKKADAAQNTLSTNPYNCRQTLAKAVKKLKQALPHDPSRKKVVLEKVATECGIKIVQPDKSKRIPWNKIPSDVVQQVKEFYQRDSISRQAPGIKDTKSVKNVQTGKRESIQKRHLVMTVKEAFQIFSSEHPDMKIHFSKFMELRPQHVLPSSDMPHNVCVCSYHANVTFILDRVSKDIKEFPKTHRLYLKRVSCDIDSESCMTGVCKQCTVENLNELIPSDFNVEKHITWNQWKKVEVEEDDKRSRNEREKNEEKVNGKKKKKEVMKLIEIKAPIKDALQQLLSQTSAFKTHHFVKNMQSQYFEERKRNIGPNEAIAQEDFSENASTSYQDEIQAAYYSHGQATVFTCCVWLKDDTICFAIVSDDLTHDKYSVWTFHKVICMELKRLYPHLESITIFTDGCTGQFKSKYVMSNLCYFEEDFNLQCEWNFFATSHGKGAVDGIGATVKRMVWQKVRNRETVVASAEDFAKCAESSVKGVKIFYVPKAEINENKEMLEVRAKCACPIPSIKAQHHFRFFDKKNLLVGRTCNSNLKKCLVIKGEDHEEVAAVLGKKQKACGEKEAGTVSDNRKTTKGGKIKAVIRNSTESMDVAVTACGKKKKIYEKEEMEVANKKDKTKSAIKSVTQNPVKSKDTGRKVSMVNASKNNLRRTRSITAQKNIEFKVRAEPHVKWNYNDVYSSSDS